MAHYFTVVNNERVSVPPSVPSPGVSTGIYNIIHNTHTHTTVLSEENEMRRWIHFSFPQPLGEAEVGKGGRGNGGGG